MSPAEQQLTEIFRRLEAVDQAALLSFAQFLGYRSRAATALSAGQEREIPEPVLAERPAKESVVAAIKRLSRSYPMLDKKEMLSATSELVLQHVVQRRDATEVIDELEAIFRERYRQLKNTNL